MGRGRGYHEGMRSRTFLLVFLGIATVLIVPHVAFAQIPYFGPIVPPAKNGCPFGWAGVIVVINNLIRVILTLILTFLAPIMIAYAGFLLVVNPFNPKGKEQAKSILWNTIIGIAVAISAWLIVNTLLVTVTGHTVTDWTVWFGSGSGDICLDQAGTGPASIPPGGGFTLPGVTTGPGPGGGTGYGGKCAVATSGACNVANMGVFGSAANQASQICNAESGSSPHKFGDLITAGPNTGSYVSIGLFQINLTQHSVGGLNCPKAFNHPFTGSHPDVIITNPALYSSCVAAALDPAKNIAAAKTIYDAAGHTWKDWSSAKACNL